MLHRHWQRKPITDEEMRDCRGECFTDSTVCGSWDTEECGVDNFHWNPYNLFLRAHHA